MDTSTKLRPRSPGPSIPIDGTAPSTSPPADGEHPVNGEGGRPPLRAEFGRVFYRSFPILLILFGFGILAIIGLWAKMAASDGPTTGSSVAAGTPVTLNVSLREFSIDPAMIQVPAGKPFVLHVTNDGQADHALSVGAPNGTVTTATIPPGSAADLKLPTLPNGSYQAWCPVPGHKDAGMAATIMVGSAGTGSAMPGMNGAGGTSQVGDGMTAAQMADAHKASTLAFPAKTAGLGDQVLQPTLVRGVKVFRLTATQVQWEVTPGRFVTAFAYNGMVPGPQIRVQAGDRVRIVLDNELPQPTVIHFHGLTVPNKDDGVPYITQDPVMPGQTFTYEFRVVDPPGTYLYHSHFNSTEQVGRGLYGAFVIEPTVASWDEEYTVILGDGPLGYNLNGKGFPATAPLTAHLGDRVLIRLANMGQLLHPMHLHGYHFQVIGQDGFPLRHPYQADTLVVAPGERYDVVVVTDNPGVWAFHCHILSHVEGPQGMFGMVTALIVK